MAYQKLTILIVILSENGPWAPIMGQRWSFLGEKDNSTLYIKTPIV